MNHIFVVIVDGVADGCLERPREASGDLGGFHSERAQASVWAGSLWAPGWTRERSMFRRRLQACKAAGTRASRESDERFSWARMDRSLEAPAPVPSLSVSPPVESVSGLKLAPVSSPARDDVQRQSLDRQHEIRRRPNKGQGQLFPSR